jgi:hypothetical protein
LPLFDIFHDISYPGYFLLSIEVGRHSPLTAKMYIPNRKIYNYVYIIIRK